MGPIATVVIPTYNRRERLATVLRGLDLQSVEPGTFDVVVVDDGSTDGTASWLEAQTFRFHYRVLRQANAGPSVARNAGIAAAAGDLVIFLDDDLVPDREFVAQHLACHQSEANVVVIGPLASLPRYDQPWVAYQQAAVEKQYQAMARLEWTPTFRQFWTGNASIARKHLLEAGGFDPSLRRAEDIELGYRLLKRGMQFRFNSRASGLHHARRSMRSWIDAHRSYGKFDVEIFSRFEDGAVEEMLSGAWSDLHPLTRFLVRGVVGRAGRFALTEGGLRCAIQIMRLAPGAKLSLAMCGALANLWYWRGVADALGQEGLLRLWRQPPRPLPREEADEA